MLYGVVLHPRILQLDLGNVSALHLRGERASVRRAFSGRREPRAERNRGRNKRDIIGCRRGYLQNGWHLGVFFHFSNAYILLCETPRAAADPYSQLNKGPVTQFQVDSLFRP